MIYNDCFLIRFLDLSLWFRGYVHVDQDKPVFDPTASEESACNK
jgi:hypothetical protein